MTRTRRAAFTYSSGLLFTAVTMVVGLIAVPLLLRWLGEERYGAFRATADWFGYLSLLELGIGGALLPLLARAAGQRDESTLVETLAAGIHAYSRVTAFMLLGGLTLLAVIHILVPVGAPHIGDLRRAALIATIGLLVTPLLPFRHLGEAKQEGYRINLLLLMQSLLITSAALLLAYSGWGITGQVAAMFLGSLFFLGTLTIREVRRYPAVWTAVRGPIRDSAAWQKIWDLNRPTVIRQICGRVSVMSDRIIVAALLGPAMVVPLFVTQRLLELAQSQIQSIGSASWAGLAELHAVGEREIFANRLIELTGLVAALGIGILVPIVAYNQHFVSLWVGEDRYASDLVTFVAAGNAFLLALITLWDWAFGGTGQVARLVPVSIVSTTLNLLISLLLTPVLGLVGPLIGTLCSTAATTAWYVPLLLRRVFDVPTGRLIRAVAVPAGWGVVYFLLAWNLGRSRSSLGWGSLALEMASLAIAYFAVWWHLMLDRSERTLFIQRFRGLLKPDRPNPDA